MPEQFPIKALAELLRGSGAAPAISQDRQAPSSIYDLQYRLVVNACALEIHLKSKGGERRIATPRLKLFQFVAIRPWLLDVVQEWSRHRAMSQLSMLNSHLRRGFLSDRMHDSVIDLLVARDVLKRQPGHLVPSAHFGALTALVAQAATLGLFLRERTTLEALAEVTITNEMLEGW